MRLYYPIEVDLYKPYPLPIMEAQQNNIGRGALVTLKANGAIIQPTNEGLSFWAKKPDGTVSFLAATLTGSNVQLDFTNQMLAVPGMVQVEIRLTSGSGADATDISTPIFSVRVNPSNINDDAPESTNEFTALVTALAEMEELKKNGLKGDPGEAATLEIGNVTASEPGSDPSVTNSGTAQEAILNFILPRGQTGPEGPAGQTQIHFSAAAEFPAAGDSTMLYVDNTVSPAIIYTWTGNAYVQASADISTVMAMLATPFDPEQDYAAGQYVTYNKQYWKFTTAKSAGEWDTSKAVATNVGTELSSVNASNTFMIVGIDISGTTVSAETSTDALEKNIQRQGYIPLCISGIQLLATPGILIQSCYLSNNQTTLTYTLRNTVGSSATLGNANIFILYKKL